MPTCAAMAASIAGRDGEKAPEPVPIVEASDAALVIALVAPPPQGVGVSHLDLQERVVHRYRRPVARHDVPALLADGQNPIHKIPLRFVAPGQGEVYPIRGDA